MERNYTITISKKLTESYRTHYFATFSNLKRSIIGQVNRTFESLMCKQFSFQGVYISKHREALSSLLVKWSNQNSKINHNTPKTKKEQSRQVIQEVFNKKDSTKVMSCSLCIYDLINRIINWVNKINGVLNIFIYY